MEPLEQAVPPHQESMGPPGENKALDQDPMFPFGDHGCLLETMRPLELVGAPDQESVDP